MITVTIQGATEIAELFGRAPEIAKKILRQTITKAGYLVENLSAQEAPADTGTLRKSIESDFSGIGEFRAEITPKADYAESVHEGHGEIRPKNAKVLAVRVSRASPRMRAKFGSRTRNGWIILGKRVKATRPNRFMDRAAVKSEPRIKLLFEEARQQIINQLSTK